MDHVHYTRWLSVFINDLKLLTVKHPGMYAEFLMESLQSAKQENNFQVLVLTNLTSKTISS